MAGVRLDLVSKRFDDGKPAVDVVSLDVRAGEFAVLVGPSGCGKTTLLRMIAGLESPTSGRISIGDREVTDLPPKERDIAMVFQNYALYPHFSVRENIGFGLKMRRVSAAEIALRVDAVADSLEIGEYLDRRPAQLSGGQRQRVALARAIVREPSVFLFDEPLSNLDAQVRANTRAELVRLHRRLGATMIYVTHDQVEAMTMAQRVAVMSRGRVEQFAPPLDVYRAPATLFVASFVGSPTINRFTGAVLADGATQRFEGAFALRVTSPMQESAVLAVRPEHLRIVGDRDALGARSDPNTKEGSPDATGSVIGSVSLLEPLGPETLVHVRLPDGEEPVVRVAGTTPLAIGDRVEVRVDAPHALVYDRAGRLVGRGVG